MCDCLSTSLAENGPHHSKRGSGTLPFPHRSHSSNLIRAEIQKRDALLETMWTHAEEKAFADLFVCPQDSLQPPAQRQRTKSTATMASVLSCCTTTSLGTEGDDDDTKLLRRLFRKTEARLCGAWDQIDQVMIWLRIVKETLRSVKREAYI